MEIIISIQKRIYGFYFKNLEMHEIKTNFKLRNKFGNFFNPKKMRYTKNEISNVYELQQKLIITTIYYGFPIFEYTGAIAYGF